jgi:hypothetical protein
MDASIQKCRDLRFINAFLHTGIAKVSPNLFFLNSEQQRLGMSMASRENCSSEYPVNRILVAIPNYNRLKLYIGENKSTWFQKIPGNETDNIPESLPNEIILVNTTAASEVRYECETELPESNDDFQGTLNRTKL